MEEAFEKLRKDGRNTVENLVKWMKDSNVLEDAKTSEEEARKLFRAVDNTAKVTLSTFKEVMQSLAAEQKKKLQEMNKNLEQMEEAFAKMKKNGKNDVDGLVKWMKESKLIDEVSEERARSLFKDVKDAQNVELPKFQEAIKKLADEQKRNVDEMTKLLEEQAKGWLDAVKAGVSAFTESLRSKK